MLCESFNFYTCIIKYIYRHKKTIVTNSRWWLDTTVYIKFPLTITLSKFLIQQCLHQRFSNPVLMLHYKAIDILVFKIIFLSHIHLGYISTCINTSLIHYNSFFLPSDYFTKTWTDISDTCGHYQLIRLAAAYASTDPYISFYQVF